MKKLMTALVLSLAPLASAQAAAPNGDIPDATLAKLGLSRMERVSDSEGMLVRGKGFIIVLNVAVVINSKNVNVGQSVVARSFR